MVPTAPASESHRSSNLGSCLIIITSATHLHEHTRHTCHTYTLAPGCGGMAGVLGPPPAAPGPPGGGGRGPPPPLPIALVWGGGGAPASAPDRGGGGCSEGLGGLGALGGRMPGGIPVAAAATGGGRPVAVDGAGGGGGGEGGGPPPESDEEGGEGGGEGGPAPAPAVGGGGLAALGAVPGGPGRTKTTENGETAPQAEVQQPTAYE